MESMNVTEMRNIARCVVMGCGARGFVRFDDRGDCLLVTDAALRCGDGGAALRAALHAAGFVCKSSGALLGINPGDALLERLCARERGITIDWESTLHPAQALAVRLMRSETEALTERGRAFVLRMARALWQPQGRVLAQMADIRAEAAVLLREGDRSGFAPAGRLLANWTDEQRQP